MAMTSILVIGLGELGEEVVKSLAQHPQRQDTKLVVLLRSKKPSQLAKLQAWNVEPIYADIVEATQNELSKIFHDYHTIISCTGMTAPPTTQLKIAKAALQANVQRYFPWQFGINYDAIGRNSSQNLFDEQLDVRDLLRSQNSTKWVIVSTGMFISFLFEPAFGLVNPERSCVTGIGSWENCLTVTAPRDIGRLTAEIAMAEVELEGVVFVSGDTISMARLADVVEQVNGRKVERVLRTVEELKRDLDGDRGDAMKKYRVVFAEGKGVAWSKEESFNGVRGIKTQSVEEWAVQNL